MGGYLDFPAPDGLKVRGTVLVVPGRGEGTETYGRFGRRIAADAYHVRVLPAGTTLGAASDRTMDDVAAAIEAAVKDLGPVIVRPVVLVGTDDGAAILEALAAQPASNGWRPDGLVLAALPGYGSHDLGDGWESELAARTQCPVHRDVLNGDASLQRGSITAALGDRLLDLAYGSTTTVPQLLLVGEHDSLADRAALARLAKALPAARLSVVQGGHHDVLNDLQHRSVAAEVVGFLEALREGTPVRPLVTVEASTW